MGVSAEDNADGDGHGAACARGEAYRLQNGQEVPDHLGAEGHRRKRLRLVELEAACSRIADTLGQRKGLLRAADVDDYVAGRGLSRTGGQRSRWSGLFLVIVSGLGTGGGAAPADAAPHHIRRLSIIGVGRGLRRDCYRRACKDRRRVGWLP